MCKNRQKWLEANPHHQESVFNFEKEVLQHPNSHQTAEIDTTALQVLQPDSADQAGHVDKADEKDTDKTEQPGQADDWQVVGTMDGQVDVLGTMGGAPGGTEATTSSSSSSTASTKPGLSGVQEDQVEGGAQDSNDDFSI